MDVLAFLGIVAGYLWIGLPITAANPAWNAAFTAAAVVFAAGCAWRKGITWRGAGMRVDTLAYALPCYGLAAALYAGGVLLVLRGSWRPLPAEWPGIAKIGGALLWALLQQFCLLSFMLGRLRQILGRDLAAAALAALCFALLHLPNPFLTLYTFGGGLVLGLLFLRLPSLPAAALAHAAASFAAAKCLAPETTGWMRVGPLYLWKQ